MTPLLRRLAAPFVVLALLLGSTATATATSASASASAPAGQDGDRARAAAAPSTPVITRTRGGDYARVTFRVARTGGAPWTFIEARGVRWAGDEAVGECHPRPLRSRGSYTGFSPGARGVWSFQVRVRNRSGWSEWSDFGRRVRIG